MGDFSFKTAAGILGTLALGAVNSTGRLLDHLATLDPRISVEDPAIVAERGREGPKSIVSADFDQDTFPDFATANLDGSLTLVYGKAGQQFDAPIFLDLESTSLRGLHALDFNGDTFSDFVTADPFDGVIHLILSSGPRSYAPAVTLEQWVGVRAITSGDFNGDTEPDLAVAGPVNDDNAPGLQILLGDGSGGFLWQHAERMQERIFSEPGHPSRPVHSLQSYRPRGSDRDSVIVGHSESSNVWIYHPSGSNTNFDLTPEEFPLTIDSPIGLQLGNLYSTDPNALDLVGVSKETGQVTIFPNTGGSLANPWIGSDKVTLPVPGAPRSVLIADMNDDGRNDLVVVLRNFSRIVIFENRVDGFKIVSELPTGASPRELAPAFINDDRIPDLLVMNRQSADVSLLLSDPDSGTMGVPRLMYPVDGQVSALEVSDLNNDGRDDILQLHTATNEISVRLAGTDGFLADPVCYSTGSRPIDLEIHDYNKDEIPDIVVTNIGNTNSDSSLSIFMGIGDGSFGDPIVMPDGLGRMFAMEAADFDGDQILDLVIGYFDCRVVFYRGNGDGTFEQRSVHPFTYEARAMTTDDFDDDGDIDLAGVGADGSVVVLVNNQDFMGKAISERYKYTLNSYTATTPQIQSTYQNEDDDPDLVVSTTSGLLVLLGDEGATFVRGEEFDTDFPTPADGAAVIDFDGDEFPDLVTSCKIASCVSIYLGSTDGPQFAGTVNVPSVDYIATGDIDGDNQTDLIGSGSVLWTVLSSTPPGPGSKQITSSETREKITHPVINEILASNTGITIPGFPSGTPDVVEIYYGGETPVDLSGWKLQLTTAKETRSYQFDSDTILRSQSQHLVIFGDGEGPSYAGFKLPREGATLTLMQGTEIVDSVTYPETPADTSYARFSDGFGVFSFNRIPDPGLPNLDNGALEPEISFKGLFPDYQSPGTPIKVLARASDDLGVFTLTMHYRRLDLPDSLPQRLLLIDDGQNGDGEMADGFFAANLPPDLPEGAEIEFFFTAIDLLGEQHSEPGNSYFAPVDVPTEHYKFRIAFPVGEPGLQISEVVSRNHTGLTEENGKNSDWIEVRNTSSSPVSLDGHQLAKKPFDDQSEVYHFPLGTILQPGEYLIVFADNDPEDGPFHAPYRISGDGESLFLLSKDARGVEEIINVADVPALEADAAWARIGGSGHTWTGRPTPGIANGPGVLTLIPDGPDYLIVFPTPTGANYALHSSENFEPNSLPPDLEVPGDGLEHTVNGSFETRRFYRLEQKPAP